MLLDIALLLAAGAAVAVGAHRHWAGTKGSTASSRQADSEVRGTEEGAPKPLKFGLPEGYEERARQLNTGSGVERPLENAAGTGRAPDSANAAEVLHAKLIKLQSMLGVALNASRRDDPVGAEIRLQEIRALRAHGDWQGVWEQRTLEHMIAAVENAAVGADSESRPINQLS